MNHANEVTYETACRLIHMAGHRPAEYLDAHPARWSDDGSTLVCDRRALAEWLRLAPREQRFRTARVISLRR